MNTKTLVGSVGIFLAGAVVGQFVGRNSPTDPPSTQVHAPTIAKAPIQIAECSPTSRDADSSPQEQLASALAQADGEWKSVQLTTAFTRLLAHSPAEALRDIDRIPVDYREQVVGAALAQLAAQQPDRVLGYIDGINENYATYLGAVLGVIAQRDPQRAVDIAIQNSHRDPAGAVFGSLIPVLIHSNLDMAASVVSAMDDAPATLIQQVGSEFARTDPERAYQWASEVARRHGRNSAAEVVDALSTSLAMSNPEVAVNFLGRTQDATLRNSLIRAISQQMGQQDLRSAWTWLGQYRTDASYSENARNLLYRWSYIKPAEVAELLSSIEDREVRAAVADELARAWQRKDPSAYQAWQASGAPR